MGLALLIIGILITIISFGSMLIKAAKEGHLKKRYYGQGIGVLVGIALIFGGFSSLDSDRTTFWTDGDIEGTINRIAGNKAKDSGGKKRIVNVSVVDDVITGDGAKLVNVTLNADEFAWAGRARDEIFTYSAKIFPALFSDPKNSEIMINWNLPLVDARGNTNERTVMTIAFTRKNAVTVNWSKFIIHDFPIVADRYYEHAIFK